MIGEKRQELSIMLIQSCSMKKIFFLFLLASAVLCNLGLDTALIERDLYKDLGLNSGATLKDIKKAFRKLAQVHHPDKSKPSNKEANEVIFREVAAAYEVLSDTSQRQEYDSMRTMRERSSHGKSQQRGRESRSQYNQYDDNDYHSTYSSGDYSNDHSFRGESREDFSFARFRPSVADTMLPANQVIFPYTPILVSPDRQHFALLDMHCSLGVYKGDVDVLIQYLLFAQQPPDLTMMPVELKFRTEGEQSLNGRCFAGLDEVGVLRVYRGHPEYPESISPLWSSNPPADDESDYSSYFQRFFLELSSSGELAVRMFVPGSSEPQCVWSTTSCNVYMALLKDMRGQVSKILLELSDVLKEVANVVKEKVVLVHGFLFDQGATETLLKNMKSHFDRINIEDSLKNLKLRFITEATKLKDIVLKKRSVNMNDKLKTEPRSSSGSSGSGSGSNTHSRRSGSGIGDSSRSGRNPSEESESGSARRKRRMNKGKG